MCTANQSVSRPDTYRPHPSFPIFRPFPFHRGSLCPGDHENLQEDTIALRPCPRLKENATDDCQLLPI